MLYPRSVDYVLKNEKEISDRVKTLAACINADYDDDDHLLLVGVLKGAFIFLADLARCLSIAHHVDFVALSSYGAGGAEGGEVRFIMDTRTSIKERNVLIVEDIMDTGRTLDYMLRTFMARDPLSVRACVLLTKPDRKQIDVPLDYVGFSIPNVWVVGYGLDYADRFRTLPYIAALKPEVYQQ